MMIKVQGDDDDDDDGDYDDAGTNSSQDQWRNFSSPPGDSCNVYTKNYSLFVDSDYGDIDMDSHLTNLTQPCGQDRDEPGACGQQVEGDHLCGDDRGGLDPG